MLLRKLNYGKNITTSESTEVKKIKGNVSIYIMIFYSRFILNLYLSLEVTNREGRAWNGWLDFLKKKILFKPVKKPAFELVLCELLGDGEKVNYDPDRNEPPQAPWFIEWSEESSKFIQAKAIWIAIYSDTNIFWGA